MKMITFLITVFVVSGINIFLYHHFVVSKFYTKKTEMPQTKIDLIAPVDKSECHQGKWIRNGQLTWDTMVFVKDEGK
jgi:hypothetical protein